MSNSETCLFIDLNVGEKIEQRLSFVEEKQRVDLPDLIDLSSLSKEGASLLKSLIDNGQTQKVISRLPESIDLSSLSRGGASLLEPLTYRYQTQEVISRLPESIDLSSLSRGGASLLKSLIDNGQTQEVISRLNLPESIDLSSLSKEEASLLKPLAYRYQAQEVISRLPESIDLSSLSDGGSSLLRSLIDRDQTQEVISRLSESIDLSSLSRGGSSLLKSLIGRDQTQEVISRLSESIDLSNLLEGGSSLLESLIGNDQTQEVISRLPESIDLSSLSDEGSSLLKSLIGNDQTQEVISRLPESIDLSSLSRGGSSLLKSLIDKNRTQEIKDKMKIDNLRKPLSLQEEDMANLNIEEKLDSVINKVIANFPLEKETKRHGWIKSSLKKTGSKTSVFIKNIEDPQNIVILFHNKKISKESLLAYKAASQLLPGYVSFPVYPELLDDTEKKQIHTTFDGYREVYAGPAIRDLTLADLPSSIRESIFQQVFHILFTLNEQGLKHNHAHLGNFNVRFLLKDQQGKKQLCFDPYRAIKTAIDSNLTLTPIVILRDWDMAES